MEISAILALIALIEPYLAAAIQKGEISAADQAQLKGRLDKLRAAATGEYTGPEWTPSTQQPS